MAEVIPQSKLPNLVGRELGPSSWVEVDQARIQIFAEATDDHQFIHVDPERAAATPFGGTVAHGFLTLSLIPHLMEEIAVVPEGLKMGINYGLNQVRFLEPVHAGKRVRLRMAVLDVVTRGAGRFLVTSKCTVEIEGVKRPALIAESLALLVCAEPVASGDSEVTP